MYGIANLQCRLKNGVGLPPRACEAYSGMRFCSRMLIERTGAIKWGELFVADLRGMSKEHRRL